MARVRRACPPLQALLLNRKLACAGLIWQLLSHPVAAMPLARQAVIFHMFLFVP